jgi:hypothetical protein
MIVRRPSSSALEASSTIELFDHQMIAVSIVIVTVTLGRDF